MLNGTHPNDKARINREQFIKHLPRTKRRNRSERKDSPAEEKKDERCVRRKLKR
jgi:hypothetical protein